MAQALLVMDIQAGIVARIEKPEQLLHNIKESIAAARKAGITVIYVTVEFREGFPEISNNNKMFDAIKKNPAFVSPGGTAIHAMMQPLDSDIHVVKRRVSAFSGSDLEIILRSRKIDHLVLCGVATSGVVLSTLREAADKDYKLTVLEDCCNDADKEVHEVLTKKVFPRQAEVVNHSAWIDTLK